MKTRLFKLSISWSLLFSIALAVFTATTVFAQSSSQKMKKKRCSGDCKDGYGVYDYENGDNYAGTWKYGKYEGQGTLTYKNGEKYTGSFSFGLREGLGVFHFKNDNRYEGHYKRDKKHGQGTLYYANQERYEGLFEDGLPNGQGTFHYLNGDRYVGEFVEGKRSGKGTMHYANSSEDRYEGEFKDDSINGIGTMYYADNNSKTGVWLEGKYRSGIMKGGSTSNSGLATQQQPKTSTSPVSKKLNTEEYVNYDKRLALVIGNSNYQRHSGWGYLPNPVNDAEDVANALRNIGFHVMYLNDLGLEQMKRAIVEFGDNLRDYDVGLFFYAGHGLRTNISDYNYLVPIDAQIRYESDVEFQCIEAEAIVAKMDGAQSDVNVMILDACRNNPFEQWYRSSAVKVVGDMDAPVGTIIAYASDRKQAASDGYGRNGLYTSALLRYIGNPSLSITEVFQATRKDVVEASDDKQRPWERSSLISDFYLIGKK
ncbi:MAG: caspase family protein [Chitinophagales bacterium]